LKITGLAEDGGCGVDPDSIMVWCGQKSLETGLSVWNENQFETVVEEAPAPGRLLRVKVADHLGNSASSYVEVRQGAQPLSEVGLKAFPCPAEDGVTVRLTVNGGLAPAFTIRLTVRDIAGDLVSTADQTDFTNQGGGVYEYSWDLTSDQVANGVYLYEVSLTDSGQAWNGRGKIVVLK